MEINEDDLDLSWYLKRSGTDLAEAKIDELFWKVEKFHYFAKKVQELNDLMKRTEAERKDKYLKEWKEFEMTKSGIHFTYENETGIDQELLFNFESFFR